MLVALRELKKVRFDTPDGLMSGAVVCAPLALS
jgi:hypothetical protein